MVKHRKEQICEGKRRSSAYLCPLQIPPLPNPRAGNSAHSPSLWRSTPNKKMKAQSFVCPDCSKLFRSKFNLHRHVDCIHLKSSQFPCSDCGKVLTSKQNFIQHMYIHSGAKPLECKACGARFRQGSLLSAHRKLHKGFLGIPKVSPMQLTDMLRFHSLFLGA